MARNSFKVYGDLVLKDGSVRKQYQQLQGWMNSHPLQPRLQERNITEPLGRITAKASEFSKSMEAATARIFAFGAAMVVLRRATQTFEQLVSDTVTVQSAFVELNSLLGVSDKTLQKFGKSVFQVARDTKRSFGEVSEAALELARQGLSATESLQRLNDAMVLSRVSGLDAASSVNALTAAINGFAKSALTSTEVVDKMLAVDTAFAVSSADLAESVSRAGSVAQDVAVSYEQLLGVTAALQQITARGGTVIGTALKSIFSRLQRTDTLDQLESLGISVRDVQGEMKPAADLLQNLARSYDQLGEADKVDLAQKIGGLRQMNILKALFRDLGSEVSLYTKSLQISALASGDAARRNDDLNKSLDSLVNKIQVTGQEFLAVFGDQTFSNLLGSFLSFTNDIGEGLVNLLKGDTVGAEFAQDFLAGIKNVITGPGLGLAVAALFRILTLTGGYVTKALGDVLHLNSELSNQAGVEQGIINLLNKQDSIREVLLSRTTTQSQKQKFIADVIRTENTNLQRQTVLIRQIAGELARLPGGLSFTSQGTFTNKKGNLAFPRFAQTPQGAIEEAIEKEVASGVPRSQVYVDTDNRVKTPENPFGLLIANTRDEPLGGSQGVERYLKKGLDPKKAGRFDVPNFALNDPTGIGALTNELRKLVANTAINVSGNALPRGFETELISNTKNLPGTFLESKAVSIETLNRNIESAGGDRFKGLETFKNSVALAAEKNKEYAKVIGQIINEYEALIVKAKATGAGVGDTLANNPNVFAPDEDKSITRFGFTKGLARPQGKDIPSIVARQAAGEKIDLGKFISKDDFFNTPEFRDEISKQQIRQEGSRLANFADSSKDTFFSKQQNIDAQVSQSFQGNIAKTLGDTEAALKLTQKELAPWIKKLPQVAATFDDFAGDIRIASGQVEKSGQSFQKTITNGIGDGRGFNSPTLGRAGYDRQSVAQSIDLARQAAVSKTPKFENPTNILKRLLGDSRLGGNPQSVIDKFQQQTNARGFVDPEFQNKSAKLSEAYGILQGEALRTKSSMAKVEKKLGILGNALGITAQEGIDLAKDFGSQRRSGIAKRQSEIKAQERATHEYNELVRSLQEEIKAIKNGYFTRKKATAVRQKLIAAESSGKLTAADSQLLRGGLKSAEDKSSFNPLRNKLSFGKAFSASIGLSFLSGQFGQKEDSSGLAKGASSALQGFSGGALALSTVAGPGGALAGGAAIGSFFALKAIIESTQKSVKLITTETEKLNEQFSNSAEGATRYVDAQNRLNEAMKEGARPEVLEQFRKNITEALLAIEDGALRVKLFSVTGTAEEQKTQFEKIVNDAGTARRASEARGSIRTGIASDESFNKGFFRSQLEGFAQVLVRNNFITADLLKSVPQANNLFEGRSLNTDSIQGITQDFVQLINELDDASLEKFSEGLDGIKKFSRSGTIQSLRDLGFTFDQAKEILDRADVSMNEVSGSILDAEKRVSALRDTMNEMGKANEKVEYAINQVNIITGALTDAMFDFSESMKQIESTVLQINQTVEKTILQDNLRGQGIGAAIGAVDFKQTLENANQKLINDQDKIAKDQLKGILSIFNKSNTQRSLALEKELQTEDFFNNPDPNNLLDRLGVFIQKFNPELAKTDEEKNDAKAFGINTFANLNKQLENARNRVEALAEIQAVQNKLLLVQARSTELLAIRTSQYNAELSITDTLQQANLSNVSNVQFSGLTERGQAEVNREKALLSAQINAAFETKKLARVLETEIGGLGLNISGKFDGGIQSLAETGSFDSLLDTFNNLEVKLKDTTGGASRALEDFRFQIQALSASTGLAADNIKADAEQAIKNIDRSNNITTGRAVNDNFFDIQKTSRTFTRSKFANNRLNAGLELANALPGFASSKAGQSLRSDLTARLTTQLEAINNELKGQGGVGNISEIVKDTVDALLPQKTLSQQLSKLVGINTNLPENIVRELESPVAQAMKKGIQESEMGQAQNLLSGYKEYFDSTRIYQDKALLYYELMAQEADFTRNNENVKNIENQNENLKGVIEKTLTVNQKALKSADQFTFEGVDEKLSTQIANLLKDNSEDLSSGEDIRKLLSSDNDVSKAIRDANDNLGSQEAFNKVAEAVIKALFTQEVVVNNGDGYADSKELGLSLDSTLSRTKEGVDNISTITGQTNEGVQDLLKRNPYKLIELGEEKAKKDLADSKILLDAKQKEIDNFDAIRPIPNPNPNSSSSNPQNAGILSNKIDSEFGKQTAFEEFIVPKSNNVSSVNLQTQGFQDQSTEDPEESENKPDVEGFNVLGEALKELENAAPNLEQSMRNLADTMNTSLGSAIFDVISGAQSGSDALRNFGKAILDSLTQSLSSNIAGSILSGAGALFFGGARGGMAPGLRGYAAGDLVTGGSGTRDDVFAKLMSGEFVMRRSAVQKYGVETMRAMNKGNLEAFATGGSVGRTVNSGSGNSVMANNIQINVSMGGEGKTESSSNQSSGQQNQNQLDQGRELSRNIKAAVIEVLISEQRTGGVLRR